jgi:hypothetical protein
VLDLDPAPGSTALVSQVYPLRDDAFMTEFADVLENLRAIGPKLEARLSCH